MEKFSLGSPTLPHLPHPRLIFPTTYVANHSVIHNSLSNTSVLVNFSLALQQNAKVERD
jgi:hypothetical protein